MRVLVTGDAGFIGSNLMNYLEGHELFGLTALNQDILSLDESKIPDFDALIHLAAIIRPCPEVWQTNINGTMNVLELAEKKGAKTVVYMSSYIYGIPKYLPIDEKHPVKPHNDYAKSKLAAELMCKYSNFENMVILRPVNIYGPNQNRDLLIPDILRQMPNVVLKGSKDERRDFLYVDDFSELVSKIIENPQSGTYNVGCGRSYSVEDIINTLNKIVLISAKYQNHPGQIKDCYVDITKAKQVFRWEPKVSLEEGLRRTYESFSNNSNV